MERRPKFDRHPSPRRPRSPSSVSSSSAFSSRLPSFSTDAGDSFVSAEQWRIVSRRINEQVSSVTKGNKAYASSKSRNHRKNASFTDYDSIVEDEEEEIPIMQHTTTIGNGPPKSVIDWTREIESESSYQYNVEQASWRLVRCQNGLRIFEELRKVDYLPRSCSRAMKAVGVVEATCDAIFELVMSMDEMRYQWDCSFQYGSVVQEVDGHTAIMYLRLLLDWFPMFVWPRDLCYVRYWQRNDDGSYVVLFQSIEHASCPPQPGFVRAHVESGGFKISPLKSRNGRPRARVHHLMQIDLKGWCAGYLPSFQKHCLLQMFNSVAGLREWFSQTDEIHRVKRIPTMVLDEYSDDDEDYQIPEPELGVMEINRMNENQ